MTGRHAGTVLPGDTFIHDQFTAWAEQIETYFDAVMAQTEYRSGSKTREQLVQELSDRHARATELLCTGRLLAAEVLRRG
jgi:hypothetical protein